MSIPLLCVVGCSGPDDSAPSSLKPGAGKAMNPSGQITDPQQQAIAKGMQQAGASANANAAKAAEGFKNAGK